MWKSRSRNGLEEIYQIGDFPRGRLCLNLCGFPLVAKPALPALSSGCDIACPQYKM
jgi:hypothetical protein